VIAGSGPWLRLRYRILLALSRFWQIESLYRANAKYRPAWVPRFVCYQRVRDLPRIASSTLQAESFIRLPLQRTTQRATQTPSLERRSHHV